MRIVVGAGAVIFVAMAVVIAMKLSNDFLPAKHLDAAKSAYFLDADGRPRLALVVLDVALDGTPVPRVLPPQADGQDVTVEIRTAVRPETAPKHEGAVTLNLVVPRASHVTVLDRRWGHPEHPEGLRFALREKPPEGWTPSSDRP